MFASIVPPPLAVQVMVWFELPETVAEYCQFAPTPMLAGAVAMLTVTEGGGVFVEDEPPPQAMRAAVLRKVKVKREIFCRFETNDKGAPPSKDYLEGNTW